MDIAAFSQLGIGVATLVILWVVVRYFIEALTKKDEYIKDVVKEFNTTVNNHLSHTTEAYRKQTAALNRLTKALGELMKELKNGRNNTRK